MNENYTDFDSRGQTNDCGREESYIVFKVMKKNRFES